MKFVKDRQPLKQTQNATMTDSTEWKLGTSFQGIVLGGSQGLSLLVSLYRIVLGCFGFPHFFLHFADIYQTVIFYSLASN